jgi:hypothetical protein
VNINTSRRKLKMKGFRALVVAFAVFLVLPALASAQTWTELTTQPTFDTDTSLLLTDGTVMMHEYNSANWYRLTPDSTGSYVNGTITQLASMPSDYKPLYFASAVLNDGNVIVEGGEYNNLSQDETNLGAFYNSALNTWTAVTPPSGWTEIGDSPSIVLANGTFMLGQNESTRSVLLDETNFTWTTTGTGKADDYSEEGFVELPDGTILTVDTQKLLNAEKYVPSTGTWVNAGNTIVELPDPGSEEIGPNILLPATLTAVAFGAKDSGAAATSIYTPPAHAMQAGTWTVGPDFPSGDGMADAPAAVLVDGNVLVETCPGIFGSPASFYEFNGTSFTSVVAPPHVGAQNTSYEGRMLDLPSGQVFYTVADGSTKDVSIYTPAGTANSAWAPTITKYQANITPGATFSIQGTQFTGLDAGAAYGDDAQMDTNFPLVRITTASGAVVYAKTHNFTTRAVATGTKLVSTQYDVPASIGTGRGTLEVVANGIASTPVPVNIQ